MCTQHPSSPEAGEETACSKPVLPYSGDHRRHCLQAMGRHRPDGPRDTESLPGMHSTAVLRTPELGQDPRGPTVPDRAGRQAGSPKAIFLTGKSVPSAALALALERRTHLGCRQRGLDLAWVSSPTLSSSPAGSLHRLCLKPRGAPLGRTCSWTTIPAQLEESLGPWVRPPQPPILEKDQQRHVTLVHWGRGTPATVGIVCWAPAHGSPCSGGTGRTLSPGRENWTPNHVRV